MTVFVFTRLWSVHATYNAMQGVTLAPFASQSETHEMRARMSDQQECSSSSGGGGGGGNKEACELFEVLCLMLFRGFKGPLGEHNRICVVKMTICNPLSFKNKFVTILNQLFCRWALTSCILPLWLPRCVISDCD